MPGNEYLINIGFRLDGQGLANAQRSLRAFEREVQATSNRVSKYKFESFAQGQQPSRTLRAADAVGGLAEAHKAQQEYLKLATTTATRKPAITPTFRGLKKSVDGYYENVVQNVGEQTKHLVSELQGLFERDSATGWRKGLETTFDKSVFGYTHVGEKIAMNYQQIIKDYGTQSFTKGIGTLYHELGHNLVGRAAQTTQYSLVNMPQAEYEQLKSPFTKGAFLSQLSDNLRPWAANYRAVEMLSGLMGGKMAYQQGVPADLLKMEHYMSKTGMQGLFEQEGSTAVQRHQQFMNTLQALGDADITTLKGQITAWNNIEQMMKSEQTRAGTVFQGMNKDMMSAMKDIVGAGKHGRLNELMGLGISGLQQGTLVATQPLMGLEETGVPEITTDYYNLASSVQKFIDQGPQVTDAYMKHVSSAHRVATSLKGTTLEYEHQQAVIKEHIAALKEHASIGERMMAAGQTPETKPRPYSEADLKGIRDTTESYYSAIQDNIREMIYAQTKQVSMGKPPARYTGEYAKVAVAQLMPQIQQMMTDLPERVQQQIMQMTQHIATGGAGGESGISGPLGIAMKRVTMWGGAAFLVYGAIRAVRKLIDEILELDKAMMGLQAVMRDVDADFGHMKDRAFDLAHEYGRTATEIINGMTEIAQTGADETEVLQKIEVAVLAANVAEIELADSAKVLTAAQEQFNLTTNELIGVVDSWNEVSRKARVGTEDLVDAMSAAGQAAGTTGVTFHELNAMIAAVAEATGKSGQEIGTAFKAMMSRTMLPKAVAALKDVGVDVKSETGDLRDFADILADVSSKWDGLTRTQQMNIANAMAEKKRYQYFLALMENYDKYLQMVEVSLNSEGSAAAENAIIMESVAKQWAQVKSVAQEFKMAFTNTFSTVAKALLPVVTLFGKMADFLSRLPLMNVVMGIGAITLALGGLEIYLTRILQVSASGLAKFKQMTTTAAGTKALFSGMRNIGGRWDAYQTKRSIMAEQKSAQTYIALPMREKIAVEKAVASDTYLSINKAKASAAASTAAAEAQVAATQAAQAASKGALTGALAGGEIAATATAAGTMAGTGFMAGFTTVLKGIGSFLSSPMMLFMIGTMFISNIVDTLKQASKLREEYFSGVYEGASSAADQIGEEYDTQISKITVIQTEQDFLNGQLDGTIARTMEITDIRSRLVELTEQEAAAQKELSEYASEIGQKYPWLVTTTTGGELTINEESLKAWRGVQDESTKMMAEEREQAALKMFTYMSEAMEKGTKSFTLGFYNEADGVGRKIANMASIGMVNKFGTPMTSPTVNEFPLEYLGEDVGKLMQQMLPGLMTPEQLEMYKRGEFEMEVPVEKFIHMIEAQFITGIDNWSERLRAVIYNMGHSFDETTEILDKYSKLQLKSSEMVEIAAEATKEMTDEESKRIQLTMTYLGVLDSVNKMRENEVDGIKDTVASLSEAVIEVENLSNILSQAEFVSAHFPSSLTGTFFEGLMDISKIGLDNSLKALETGLNSFNGLQIRLESVNELIDRQMQTVIQTVKPGEDPYARFNANIGNIETEFNDLFSKSIFGLLEGIHQRGAVYIDPTEIQTTFENNVWRPLQEKFPEVFKDLPAADLNKSLVDGLTTWLKASTDIPEMSTALSELTPMAFKDVSQVVADSVLQNQALTQLSQLQEQQAQIQGQITDDVTQLPALIDEATAYAEAYAAGLRAHFFAVQGISMEMMQGIASIGMQLDMPGISGLVTQRFTTGLEQIQQTVKETGEFGPELMGEYMYGLQGLMAQEQAAAQKGASSARDTADNTWSNMKRILEHFKTLEQITIKQYIEGLKYLQSVATKLSDKLQVQEDIYNAEKELAGMRLDYGKKWLDHEYTLERMSLSEKVAYYKQLATLARTRDEKWQIEEEIFRMEREAIDDRLGKATKWLDHFVAMDAITKESQMKILRKMLEIAKGSSDIYAQWGIEEKIHQLQKEMEGSGESDFAKRIVRRAAGLESPLRMSLEEYKKFMGEGASATDEAKDMLSEFEEYMRQFGGAGRDAAVNTKDLNAVIEDLIDTEFDNTISTDQLYKSMQSLGAALNSESSAANSAASSTVTFSSKIKDYYTFLENNFPTQDEFLKTQKELADLQKDAAEGAKAWTPFVQALAGLGPLANLVVIGLGGATGNGSSAGQGIPSGGGSGGSVGAPIVFPAPPGTYSYSNDWGAPRSVGRTHKGTDIMAPLNTPALAVASGQLSFMFGGNAGLYAALDAGAPWNSRFYYMHLNGVWDPRQRRYVMADEVGRGGTGLPGGYRVFPGQPFGLIGHSGNASPGAEHIHFEWHPGGGPAVNPYFYLRAYDWRNYGPISGFADFLNTVGTPTFLQYLNTGGQTLGDGLAFLHKKEVILNPPLVEKLERNSVQPSVQYYDNSSMNVTIGGDDTGKMQKLLDEYTEKKARTIAREVNRLI